MRKLILIILLVLIILISGCTGTPPEEPGVPVEKPAEVPESAGLEENLTEAPQQNETSTGQEETAEWRSETVDDDGWVGIDSSIAVDADGNPHISHYDQGNRDLKYAYWVGGFWQKETIDSQGDVGEESGIAVDSKGNPHISYIDATNGGLKYARREGSWSIETVDQVNGYHVVTTSIALDASDYPRIIYNMQSDDRDLVKYAYWDGSSWNLETVSTNGIDVYLVLDSEDNPHACFVKDSPDDKSRIYHANKASGSWSAKVADSSALAGGDCGIATDSKNHPHITYHDYGSGAVKYASWDGTSWNIQTVAADVGNEEGLKMAVDALDNPHIIYSDSKRELLMHATWNGSSWIKETVNSMGNPSVAIDHLGRLHVSHGYTVEGETEILKYSVME